MIDRGSRVLKPRTGSGAELWPVDYCAFLVKWAAIKKESWEVDIVLTNSFNSSADTILIALCSVKQSGDCF